MRLPLLLVLAAAVAFAQEDDGATLKRSPNPDGALKLLLDKFAAAQKGRLRPVCHVEPLFDMGFANPCHLEGDFDGDKKTDIAVLVESVASKKKGVAIIRAAGGEWIAGAGKPTGGKGDNFDWMDAWALYRKADADEEPANVQAKRPKLKGDAIKVVKTEHAAGLLYWDGKKLAWQQQKTEQE